MNFRTLKYLFAVVSLYGCVGANLPPVLGKLNGSEISVRITRIEDAEKFKQVGTTIYGDVEISSPKPIARFNLNCIILSSDDKKSSIPYVDSIAYIETLAYPADKDGVVRTRVYWIFDGLKLNDKSVKRLNIFILSNGNQCATYN